MANVYATKSGNWSDTTVWNTGSLPTSNDDVYTNTYTVTIDQNVTVLSLRNTSSSGISSGGSFSCSTARSITASGSGLVTVQSVPLLILSNSAGSTVNVTANVTSGGNTNGNGINVTANGTLNVTGNVAGNAYTSGIAITAGATVTVTGNVNAGSSNGNGITINSASSATLSVIGNVTGGGAASGGYGISAVTNCVISVTGNVYGGAGSGSANAGINTTTTGTTVNIVGQLIAQANPAIWGSATYTVTGPFICSAAGVFPVTASIVKLNPINNNEFRFLSSAGGTASLWSPDMNGGQPAASNVRSGVAYGVGGALTGTCAVPAAASVAYGVPVDNTTGTAALAPADIAALVGAQITAALDALP